MERVALCKSKERTADGESAAMISGGAKITPEPRG